MEQKKQLPSDFINEMTAILGEQEFKAFEKSMLSEPSVSIRRNPLKSSSIDDCFGISDVKIGNQVPWSNYGYYLDQRPQFTADPLLHAGCYYVQEASSMFLEEVVRQNVKSIENKDSICALDLCAAPGGKSAALLSALPEGSMLVSNEIMRQRSQVLGENLTKIGAPAVIVCNNEAKDFQPLGTMFDIIVTDVPCSGEGMFRKDDEAIADWSLSNVNMCAERQRDIVNDIWPCLKPGGLLIYSTCTFNLEEDEKNVKWIASVLGAEVLDINKKDEWQITGCLDGSETSMAHFMPHKNKGEGFFIAVMKKTDETVYSSKKQSKKKGKGGKNVKSQPIPPEAKKYVINPDNFTFLWQGENLIAFPNQYIEQYQMICEACHIVCAGIGIGTIKGHDLVPSHSLAMSTKLNTSAFETEEIDYRKAIDYLRKEAITLSPEAPRGYVLLTYHGHPLGFCKNIGNRANNMYPSEWRIRKQM